MLAVPRFIVISLCGLACIGPRAAALSESADDELASSFGDAATISIATGSQKPLRLAPAVASVISAADIKAMGALDLDQVLETVPGLHVARVANIYGAVWTMRGIYSEFNPQVLVLQNGMPMTTLFIGSRSHLWSGYPLHNIARIEIIRGPGSALYGADAFSGVINLITKSGEAQPGTELGIGAASFNNREAWLRHGGKWGRFEVAGYVRVGRTDGSKDVIESDAQNGLDQAFGSHASLAPGTTNRSYDAIDANLELGLDKWRWRGGYILRDNIGLGVGAAPVLDPVGRASSERISSELSFTDAQFARNFGLGLNLSAMQYLQRIPEPVRVFPPGASFPTGSFPQGMIGKPETSERQLRFSAFAQYSGFANHRLRMGGGHDDLNMYDTREAKNFTLSASGLPIPAGPIRAYYGSDVFLPPHRRKIDYLYLQDEWQFAPDWTLTAGVRHDHYSDVGHTTNPRLALVWQASYNLNLKLLYGQAFRAPAFIELYSLNNPTQRGNPNVRPETIKTLEAALIWQADKNTQVKLNAYHFRQKDIINNVPDTPAGTGSAYANVGRQDGHGLETELNFQPAPSLRLSGNYSFQRNIDKTTNTDAGYAPHHHVFARADYNFASEWFVSPQLNWVAARKRAFGDARPPIADYRTLDLSIRTSSSKWELSATVRNLFNTDAREPSLAPGSIYYDLPLPRRSFELQASYRL